MTEQELLLTALLNCPRHQLYLDPPTLTPEQEAILEQMQIRRKEGEPLQYIVGFTEFMGLKFFVDERVLIPRPETEFLVEVALADARLCKDQPVKVLDLGTGSGCIAVSMAKFIADSRVTAVDISEGALSVARRNAAENGVAGRVDFVCRDIKKIFQENSLHPQIFDMIMANPPYIPSDMCATLPEDVRREPRLALDGGTDGLDFYRAIIEGAGQFLKTGGCVYLEIGEDQRESIRMIVDKNGSYSSFECLKDYTGRDRVVKLTR